MPVTKSHYNYMLGNSLLNKLWNIITGCIVSLMQYCSQQRQLETMGGRHKRCIPQCWTCWQEYSTAGRPRHCRSCCPLEKLSLVHRLPDSVLLSHPLSSAGDKRSREGCPFLALWLSSKTAGHISSTFTLTLMLHLPSQTFTNSP